MHIHINKHTHIDVVHGHTIIIINILNSIRRTVEPDKE